MKYFLLLMLATTIATSQTTPYTETAHKARIGINAGPEYTTLRGGFGKNYEPALSFFAGVSFEYRFNESLSLCANANYDRQPFNQHYRSTTGTAGNYESIAIRETLVFQYLSVPLLLRYYMGTHKLWFADGGVFCNYQLDRSASTTNSSSGTGVSALQYDGLFKKQVFGLSLGGGYNFELTPTASLALELRDDFGLSDLRTKSYNGASTNTNAIKVVANYTFNIWKKTKKLAF